MIGHKGDIIRNYLGENVKFAEHKNFTGNMGAVLDSIEYIDNKTTEILIIQGDDCVFLDEKELGIIDFIAEEFKDGKNIYGFESNQPWMEINNKEQLKKARDFISKGKSMS